MKRMLMNWRRNLTLSVCPRPSCPRNLARFKTRWKFDRVLRGNDAKDKNLDTDFDFMKRMPIEGNPYGDEILFMIPVTMETIKE